MPEDDIPVSRWRLIPTTSRFVKTHASYLWRRQDFSTARAVIYVIRDPRDVVISHYRYLQGLYGYTKDMRTFLDDWLAGRFFPGSWSQHVRSWTDDGSIRHPRLLVVRFEDLRSNCEGEISRICLQLHLPFSDEDIHSAVQQANLSEMKLKEARGIRKIERQPSFSFINQGSVGGWQNLLTREMTCLIERDCGAGMMRFAYPLVS